MQSFIQRLQSTRQRNPSIVRARTRRARDADVAPRRRSSSSLVVALVPARVVRARDIARGRVRRVLGARAPRDAAIDARRRRRRRRARDRAAAARGLGADARARARGRRGATEGRSTGRRRRPRRARRMAYGGPGPPYALLQGALEGLRGTKAEGEAPIVARGYACVIGSGPDFFIATRGHAEWGRAHACFAEAERRRRWRSWTRSRRRTRCIRRRGDGRT